MKKNILTTALLFFTLLSVAFSQKKAGIKFDSRKHNFGQINKANTPTCSKEFMFTNTGDAPLIISKVSTSKECVTAEYDKLPILPGKKGKIKVKFDPKSEKGDVSYYLIINSNAKNSADTVYLNSKVINEVKMSLVNKIK